MLRHTKETRIGSLAVLCRQLHAERTPKSERENQIHGSCLTGDEQI